MTTTKNIIFTSYYARNAQHPDAVSISVRPPRWYPGLAHYPALAPTWEIVKAYKEVPDISLYTTRYLDLLESRDLDPNKIAADLHGKILLCYEKPSDFCHRHLVAWWLEHEAPGTVVREILDPKKDKKGKFNVLLNCFEI